MTDASAHSDHGQSKDAEMARQQQAELLATMLAENALPGPLPGASEAESLQYQAYATIRQGIAYAVYAPGDKLMVRDLCSSLGMGRTPIRESLVRLRQEGLVYAVPQSGTYVSRISVRSIGCARYVREHLEREVAIECCAKAQGDDLDQLAAVIRDQERAIEEGDRRAFFDGDNDFHQLFYRIAGRERVWEWLRHMSFDLQRYRWLRMLTEELDWNSIMNQHYAIWGALANKNTDEVGYLVSDHLHLLYVESAAVFKSFPDYFDFDM